MPMELEQLRQLDAIARTGTFSAAADELHTSQPSTPVVHLTQSQAPKTANCGGGFACLDRFFGINPVTNLESGTKNAYNKKSCHNLKLSLF